MLLLLPLQENKNIMTQNKELISTFKDRSYRSCISDALQCTIKSAPEIIKAKWNFLIAIAILQGALFAWQLSLSPGILYVGFKFQPRPIILSCVLAVAIHIIIYSTCFSFVNERKVTWNIFRAIKTIPISSGFLFLYLVIVAAISGIYISCSKVPENIPLLNIILLATAALPILYIITIPLLYVYTRYQMEENAKLAKSFIKAYSTGFRYCGFIFTIQFLTALCLAVFELIICMPQYILIVSQNISAIGTASLNDPSGLPSGFYIISTITGTIYGGIRFFTTFFAVKIAQNCYQAISARLVKAGKNI